MTDMDHLNTIHSALKALSLVRSATLDTLKYLANSQYQSFRDVEVESESNKSTPYMLDLNSLSNSLDTHIRELETACTLLYPAINSLNLANTQLVAQDPNYEKTSLYSDMVISHRWLSNTQEYSTLVFQALQAHFTKRNSRFRQRSTSNQRFTMNNHNMNKQIIETLLVQLQRTLEDMTVEVVRSKADFFGVFTVLKVYIEKTFRAIIVVRGLVIEWVLVKSLDENFDKPTTQNSLSRIERRYQYQMSDLTQDDSIVIDIYRPSRYKIFRMITDHANAALLHFYAPFQMESAIKAFMIWFRSYSNLFTALCKKCDYRLLNGMPPTWRDLRTNDPYHFECRP